MLLGTLGCSTGDTSTNHGNETSGTNATAMMTETQPAETELTRINAQSSVSKMDLGGIKIGIGYIDVLRHREDFVGEDTGEVVSSAVYGRNLEVEEKFNIKFDLIATETSLSATAQPFVNAVSAGDHLYDIYNGTQCYTIRLYTKGYFTNMADDKYIDWDKPWWKVEYMDELQLGGTRFFLFSDATFGMLRNAGCVYFNKTIMNDTFHLSDEDIYKMVFDGKWTFDLYTQYVADAYQDLNGNGQVDTDDLLGSISTTYKSVEHYQYPCEIRTTARDKDGKPYFILNNERTVKFAEKLYKLYFETKGFIIPKNEDPDVDMLDHFVNGKTLFLASWFYQSGLMRDMKADYGIIPYPKLDETQEEYKSLVHDGCDLMCIPVTIPKDHLSVIGAVIEDLSVGAYRTVTPAYFEMALKGKYSRDNTSSQILDMLADNLTTDFGYGYSYTLKNIGMLRPLIQNKTKDFASWYASTSPAAQTALDELITAFLEATK